MMCTCMYYFVLVCVLLTLLTQGSGGFLGDERCKTQCATKSVPAGRLSKELDIYILLSCTAQHQLLTDSVAT